MPEGVSTPCGWWYAVPPVSFQVTSSRRTRNHGKVLRSIADLPTTSIPITKRRIVQRHTQATHVTVLLSSAPPPHHFISTCEADTVTVLTAEPHARAMYGGAQSCGDDAQVVGELWAQRGRVQVDLRPKSLAQVQNPTAVSSSKCARAAPHARRCRRRRRRRRMHAPTPPGPPPTAPHARWRRRRRTHALGPSGKSR